MRVIEKLSLEWQYSLLGKEFGMLKRGKFAGLLEAMLMAAMPMMAYGFEMIGEYYEISCHEAGAFIFDGTTVTEGTTGRLILTKLKNG